MVYFPNHAQTAKLRIPTSVLTNGQSGLPNTFRWLCKWASRQFNSSGQFRDPSHVLAPGETCFSLSQSAMFTKLLVFVQFPQERFKILLFCTVPYMLHPCEPCLARVANYVYNQLPSVKCRRHYLHAKGSHNNKCLTFTTFTLFTGGRGRCSIFCMCINGKFCDF